jgi:hypothetical protein
MAKATPRSNRGIGCAGVARVSSCLKTFFIEGVLSLEVFRGCHEFLISARNLCEIIRLPDLQGAQWLP